VRIGVIVVLLVALFAVAGSATVSAIYFASDPNGQNRVTNIQEGNGVWICVYDPDQNLDCDHRDKLFTDITLVDPNTNARLNWNNTGDTTGDFLEETNADTGLFVSSRYFRIGARANATAGDWTHTAGDFTGGADLYIDGIYSQLGVPGRVENMDALFGTYRDPNDATDTAIDMLKIVDAEASISWDKAVYLDANGSASITVVDTDENLNSNEIEYVPVFIVVNPGSWNPVRENSASNFCMIERYGGVNPETGAVLDHSICWNNIYDSGLSGVYPNNSQPTRDGVYYLEYPTSGDVNVVSFDTADPNGFCRVMFYAQETGVSTGVFKLPLNDIRVDLGFNSFNPRDVLVAYYLDPNDEDDFALSTAYIEEHQHSGTCFTDATRGEAIEYWIGRDAIHVQVIDANANVDSCTPEQVVVHICDPHGADDAEWIILDETLSNSPVFFNNTGTQLRPVWDSSGLQVFPGPGGYQLQLDNWRFEVYNEDTIYARYNDVYYANAALWGLGDANTSTAFPPEIRTIRVANDLSFDTVKIADTQVYDGQNCSMYFLDRQGNRVSGYGPSDCVFIEVIDLDQNEDPLHRERIDAYWDGRQDLAYAMQTPDIYGNAARAKIYIANPRNGHWAAIDVLETGVGTGDFVSVTCIDLVDVYESVPTLGVLPGDTILAYYQDPSNHSDFSAIQIKVSAGGPSYHSTTTFTDAVGNEVASYTNADDVHVKVVDSSHGGAVSILDAVGIEGQTFDLTPLTGAPTDTFITDAISMTNLGVNAGDTITATYTDPTDPTDISSDTISITTLYVSCYFTYRLISVDPVANTFTLSFEGRSYTYPDTVEVTDWDWSFCDDTEGYGQVVTRTFSGLGEVCNVALEATVGAASGADMEVIWGIGGIAGSLQDALETGDASGLQQLQGALSWSGGSVEKIYRACVDASLEVYDLADRYGLTSMNQVSQALTEAMKRPLDLLNHKGVGLAALTKPFEEAVKPLQAVLGRLPGLGQLLGNPPLETNSIGQRELVGSITLPQIYQEAEDIATFVDDLLTNLSPIVNDGSFELQFPTCVGCTPNLYMSLDNGDIAGILVGIAAAKAGLEALLAYTPGDLFMNNLEFQFFDDGSVEAQGWDTITNSLWDSFHAARGNGILDLNGSGDGDAALGFEVLPTSCLTLRDGQWLQSAKANLVQALAWLRTAIQDMPTSPGPHDPQIEWPLEMYWPWSDESVWVSKEDLLNLIDAVEACLQGPTAVDIDIDFDGATDHSTMIDLSALFDTPIPDLKVLLPDLVTTSDPNDPLIVLSRDLEGIDQDWKIDGRLNWSTEHVSINLPDPTLGGVLPNGDANDLLALLLFGHINPACQNQESVLEVSGWHMVSLPGELCSPCVNAQCGDVICALDDDLNPCYIFHYDPGVGGYVMAPPADSICYHAGMGFWARTYEGNVLIDADLEVPTNAVEVSAQNGWNQVGNPFNFGVALSNVTVRYQGNEASLQQAQANGWVSAYLFGYDTASGGYVMIDPVTGCLQPWNGYWMRSYQDGCVLIIPPTECSSSAPAGQPMSTKELEARGLELPPPPPTFGAMSEAILGGLVVRNVPNPIRSQHTTTFKVEGKGAELVQAIRVEIYNQAGQRVFTQDINAKELEWHTNNEAGELLANGVYLYQVWVEIAGAWYPTGVHKLAVVR